MYMYVHNFCMHAHLYAGVYACLSMNIDDVYIQRRIETYRYMYACV